MFQIKWLFENLKGRRFRFAAAMVLSAFTMALVIINPKLSQILVDDVLRGGETGKLLPVLGAMCGIVLARSSLRYLMVILLEQSSQSVLYTVRHRVFSVMQGQDAAFYDLYRTGDLMTRITGDMDLIRHFTAWITFQTVDSITVFIAAIAMLSTINIPFTLMLLALTPVIAAVSILFMKKVRPLFSVQREKLSSLNTFSQENIAANRVVKAFAREDYEINVFNEKNEDFRKANLQVNKMWLKFFPVIEASASSLTLITILAGGLFIIGGTLTYGELTAFMGLTWAIANPMRNIGTLLNDLQRFFVSADKIIELFYSRANIVSKPDAVRKDHLEGNIEFKNVSFKFKQTPVLKDISFTVNAGETVAIMGPTGSGKTTIANLICRFYDADEGELLIDGIPVSEYDLTDLRRNIGLAAQEVFLFSDTVDGNISFGVPEIPEEETKKYAGLADADEFISKMELGYNTIIGERGAGLSGGQRQRIALARALAKRPPVLILDDTTSALDSKTEEYIKGRLRTLDFPCTKIIIAQRISSVQDADKILILEDGGLTIGTHDELSLRPGYYREICELQNVQIA